MTHLGVYYTATHRIPEDADYIRKLQPPVIRLLDPDVQQIADMHTLVPGAIICPRTWAIDDNSGAAVRALMADPVTTGYDHANQYRRQLDRWKQEAAQRGLTLPPDDHIYFNAANEPNQGGTPDKIAAYTVAFLNRCTELNIRATALCLGVGWPDNSGPGTPVNWQPYASIVDPIQRGGHWLETHEYFDKTGPQDGWTWWAGRHLQCPFDVPILLGEIGMDRYVRPGWDKNSGNRGWQGNVDPNGYGDMIQWHISHGDTRVVAALVFITDIANKEWASFNTRPAHGAFLARKDNMVPQTTPKVTTQSQPSTVHIPAISTGPQQPPAQPQPIAAGIIDPRVAQAILQIESGGQSFGPTGEPLIRFEAHIFKSQLQNDALWSQYFQVDADVPWTNQQWRAGANSAWQPIHTGKQADEYAAFQQALLINPDAAYNSISMGAGQIMGFNHARVGFPTAQAMYEAFKSAPVQTIAFINYFLSDPALVQAMQNKDWRTIAKLYNGSGAVDSYSKSLQQAYEAIV